MPQHPHAQALAKALKQQIRARGTSAAAISLALGQHPAFLSRALNGQRPLRVEVVFAALHQLHILPFEFFWMVFPFGGTPLPASQLKAHSDPSVVEFRELTRRLFQRRGRLSSDEYRLRIGAWVKEEIARRDRSVRQVSLAMGLGPTALGKALRGESQLTFTQVFRALEAVRTDPGRLFVSLFLPDLEDPFARLEREEVLRYLEAALITGDPAFEVLRKRKARQKQKPKKEPWATPTGAGGPPPRTPRRATAKKRRGTPSASK